MQTSAMAQSEGEKRAPAEKTHGRDGPKTEKRDVKPLSEPNATELQMGKAIRESETEDEKKKDKKLSKSQNVGAPNPRVR